jgi:septum site-determining protein MinD
MSRLIGIISGKGGVGKTTIVSNLSCILSTKFKKSVTVIDCNFTTSHLSMHFGIYFHPLNLNNVLKDEASIEEVIIQHSSGVKLIPASLNLSDLVGVDVSILYKKIKDLSEIDDFVFLDTAPGFGKEAISAINACREAILVATPDIPSITDIMRAKNVLEDMNVKTIGIVLNKVTGKNFELTGDEIAKLTDLPIIAKIPFDLKLVESVAAKIPHVLQYENSDVTREFIKLASIITGETYEIPKLSFFQRLKRILKRFW